MGKRLMTRISGWRQASGWRAGAAIGAGFVIAGGLAAGVSTLAGAAPQPSIGQVQALVNADQAKFDKANQQYDAATTQLSNAKARLAQVNGEAAADTARFRAARTKVVQIAAANYEDSGATSLAGLLTTSDAGSVLSMASIITELTGTRNAQTQVFLTDAQQLASVQQEQRNYEKGIEQLVSKRAASKKAAQHTLDQENATLDSLTAAQKAAVQQTTVGGSTGTTGSTGGTYTGPTSTQAEKAVAFAYAQLGCPYLYGGTGPCHPGFDCSGLVQAAWAAAGVSIPRDTYSQYPTMTPIPTSALQPGDVIFYNGYGHEALYVGGGYIIDAPRTGLNVEKIPMSTSWYASSMDGAYRV